MKDGPSAQSLRQYSIALTNWHDDQGRPLQLTVVLTDNGLAYFPLTLLCRALGVDPRSQLDRLREHAVLSQLICQLKIETSGGPQSAWCIERRGIGFWWGSIQLSKVREQVQQRLRTDPLQPVIEVNSAPHAHQRKPPRINRLCCGRLRRFFSHSVSERQRPHSSGCL